jgi:hypothetical protein
MALILKIETWKGTEEKSNIAKMLSSTKQSSDKICILITASLN